jgi:hypothetical protein
MHEFCPLCLKNGNKVRIKSFQLNFQEAVLMCATQNVRLFVFLILILFIHINLFIFTFMHSAHGHLVMKILYSLIDWWEKSGLILGMNLPLSI